jgi:5-methylcytosine-specific restriction endonuclease McrA
MTPTERMRRWRLKYPKRYVEMLREWRSKNPEYMREYRRKNRAKIAEQMREWRLKNAIKVKEYNRLKKLKDRGKIAEQFKRWRLNNPAKRNKTEALRRARKRLVTVGDLTDIQKIYDRCNELRQWFKVVVDHIIPLALGGAHEASNLQIIYDFENARKGIKPNYKPQVIFT